MKIVVFKARFRNPEDTGYDVLHPPACPADGTQYVMFADVAEPRVDQGWTILPAVFQRGGHRLRARQHKIMAHELFPDADYTIWLDGVFQPLVEPTRLVRGYLDGADMAMFEHPARDCLYAEAKRVIKSGKDDPDLVRRHVAKYKADGYPARNGLHATGALLRRHTPAMAAFNELWWRELASGSIRDQLSFDYCRHKMKLNVARFPGVYKSSKLFRWRPHRESQPATEDLAKLLMRRRAEWFPEWIHRMRFGRMKSVLGLCELIRDLNLGPWGIEIGSFAGESSLIFMECGVRRLTCVDYWPKEVYEHRRIEQAEVCFDRVAAHYAPRIEKVRGRSPEALKAMEAEGRRFDFAYIDGDHSKEAVLADNAAVMPLVRPGGWVCGHDYGRGGQWDGVTKAVDGVFGCPNHTFRDSSWAVRV